MCKNQYNKWLMEKLEYLDYMFDITGQKEYLDLSRKLIESYAYLEVTND